MWAILTSKLGLAGIALVGVLALFGIQEVRLKIAQHTVSAMQAAQIAAKADVQAHEAAAVQVSSTVGSQLTARRTAIASTFTPLLKRVQTDVSDQDDADCRVPLNWSRLWLAGATGADPSLSAAASGSQGPVAETPGASR